MGGCLPVPEILFQAEITPGSISGALRKNQVVAKALIIEGAKLRRAGKGEKDILEKAQKLTSTPKRSGRVHTGEANYFIGRLLQSNRDPRCREYYLKSIISWPFNIKAIIRGLESCASMPFLRKYKGLER